MYILVNPWSNKFSIISIRNQLYYISSPPFSIFPPLSSPFPFLSPIYPLFPLFLLPLSLLPLALLFLYLSSPPSRHSSLKIRVLINIIAPIAVALVNQCIPFIGNIFFCVNLFFFFYILFLYIIMQREKDIFGSLFHPSFSLLPPFYPLPSPNTAKKDTQSRSI